MNNAGVSVGILVKNQEANLIRCLQSLAEGLDFPVELLVVDHGSTDASIKVIKEKSPSQFELKIFLNTENNLGASRNFLLQQAKYPFLAFIDSDCEAPAAWLTKLRGEFFQAQANDSMLIGVGGANISPAVDNNFYQALRIMCSSPLGNGGSTQAKTVEKSEILSHIPTCNLLLHVERAKSVGGFSHHFPFVCEDLEFSTRASSRNYHFLFLADCSVFHWHIPSFLAWAQKMFRYGRGQVLVQRKHPRHMLGVRGLPFLGIVLAIFLALTLPKILLIGAGIYFLGIFLYSLLLGALAGQIHLTGAVAGLFFCTHIPYGLGEFFEFIYPHRQIEHGEVKQRKDQEPFILLNTAK